MLGIYSEKIFYLMGGDRAEKSLFVSPVLSLRIFNFYPEYIYLVSCSGLRTHDNYFPVQHSMIGLYNRDGSCLQRGTN